MNASLPLTQPASVKRNTTDQNLTQTGQSASKPLQSLMHFLSKSAKQRRLATSYVLAEGLLTFSLVGNQALVTAS
jgi:hypothetical protein